MPDEVTVAPGAETSEKKVTGWTGLVAKIIAVLGILGTVASLVASLFGVDATVGIIAGTVVTVSSELVDMFVALGYNKGRAVVKAAASNAIAKIAAAAASPKASNPAP